MIQQTKTRKCRSILAIVVCCSFKSDRFRTGTTGLLLWFPKRIFWENRKPTNVDDLAMFKLMFHCEIRLPKASPPGTAYTLQTCLSYLIIIIRFAHEQSQPNEYYLSIYRLVI
jgi:hypothetical protein